MAGEAFTARVCFKGEAVAYAGERSWSAKQSCKRGSNGREVGRFPCSYEWRRGLSSEAPRLKMLTIKVLRLPPLGFGQVGEFTVETDRLHRGVQITDSAAGAGRRQSRV
jgi:hypothetical protein